MGKNSYELALPLRRRLTTLSVVESAVQSWKTRLHAVCFCLRSWCDLAKCIFSYDKLGVRRGELNKKAWSLFIVACPASAQKTFVVLSDNKYIV